MDRNSDARKAGEYSSWIVNLLMIYLCIAGRSRFAHLDVDYLWLASRDDRRAPNTWLSRQKPVMVCCPKCKKPLHRCSIWLFYLRAHKSLNGVQREHSQYPRSCMPTIGSGGGKSEGMENLAALTTLPFATWLSPVVHAVQTVEVVIRSPTHVPIASYKIHISNFLSSIQFPQWRPCKSCGWFEKDDTYGFLLLCLTLSMWL